MRQPAYHVTPSEQAPVHASIAPRNAFRPSVQNSEYALAHPMHSNNTTWVKYGTRLHEGEHNAMDHKGRLVFSKDYNDARYNNGYDLDTIPSES